MAKNLKELLASALNPWSWLLAIIAIAGTGWMGYETLEGRILVGAVGVLMYLVAVHRTATRRRFNRLFDKTSGSEFENKVLGRMLHGVRGALWQCDTDRKRTFVSDQWTELTGQSVDKAKNEGWMAVVHEDDLTRYATAARLAAGGLEPYEVEYRLLDRDGNWHWACDRAAPFLGDNGVFGGYAGITMLSGDTDGLDGSGETRIKRTLRLCDSINNMSIELADRYQSLASDKERAEFADVVKVDFLSALVEDLRDPIEEVASATKLLKVADIDKTHKEFVDRLDVATSFVSKLHGRARSFSALDESPENIELSEFDLRALVEEVIEHQQPDKEERGKSIGCFVGEDIPGMVSSDPMRLRRLLVDLCATSLRTADKGHFVLRVFPDKTPGAKSLIIFSIALSRDAVTDEQIERAYYPRERMGDDEPGLGLGPCKRLVELMGGKMGLQPDGVDMLDFWISLPLEVVNPNWDGRRSHGRLNQDAVECNLGQVLDLSLGGLRVQCAEAPEGEVELEVFDEEETLVVKGEVCWTRRVGFGKHQAGLKFIDLDDDTAAQLGRLGTRNRLRQAMNATS